MEPETDIGTLIVELFGKDNRVLDSEWLENATVSAYFRRTDKQMPLSGYVSALKGLVESGVLSVEKSGTRQTYRINLRQHNFLFQ
jgi:hypothetical protein